MVMTSPTEQKQQKMVNLFIKLSEVTGFISKKESVSTQHRLRTTIGRAKNELQDLVCKHNIDADLAKLIWQIVQKSPALHIESQEGKDIEFDELNVELQKQIILAERLSENKICSLQEINNALAEYQQNPSTGIGQILLRKRVLTSEQFVGANKHVQNLTGAKPKLVHLSLKLHGHRIYLNSSNIPKTIGNYEIIREIARGGMGVVYQAKDPDLEKIVALKTIIAGEAADAIDIERFRREAKLTAHLDHPNIVKIHEVGMQDNLHYYTMDYVEGVSLSEYTKKNKPSLRKLLKIFLQISDALTCAHTNKIIHRDIKPSNILVDESGKPLLTDFGLARQEGGKDGLTMSGVAIGTPAYMSPEQAEGRIREIDERSDLYSLGAVFYELLSGQPPFSGQSLAETLQMILTKEPVRLKQLVPNIPLKVETICLKCLKKNKNHRYSNAKALTRDIERFLKGDEIKAKRSVPLEALKLWLGEYKSIVLTTAIVSVVFITILFFTLLSLNKNKTLYSEKQNELQKIIADLNDSQITLKNLTSKHDALTIEKEILEKKLSEKKKKNIDLNVPIGNEELAVLYNDAGIVQLNNKKSPTSAIEFFGNAIKCNPGLMPAYNNRGAALIQLKKFPEAINELDIVINNRTSSETDILNARNNRGYCYFLMKEYQKSIDDVNYCIQREPDKADYYNQRALAYAESGRKREAIIDINKAISLVPAIDFYYNRARIYLRHNDKISAKKDLERCLKANYRRDEILAMLREIGN